MSIDFYFVGLRVVYCVLASRVTMISYMQETEIEKNFAIWASRDAQMLGIACDPY
jgi:hypothetical protein